MIPTDDLTRTHTTRCPTTGDETVFVSHKCSVLGTQMLITRVDIAQAHDIEDFSADGSTAAKQMVLSFEDGSDQLITLVGNAKLWSYYIRPVVSSFVTMRAVPRDDDRVVRLAMFEVYGQNTSELFTNGKYVNIFEPGYARVEGDSVTQSYGCPPTTFATSYPPLSLSKGWVVQDAGARSDDMVRP